MTGAFPLPVSLRPRLLIVDDVLENRDILCRRFERRGFTTFEAESGEHALNLLQEQPFDLVLLDIEMPGLDGHQTLSLIRERHSSTSLPVIMVTGRTQQVDVMAALKGAANDYISKPVDFSLALSRVEAQLRIREDAAIRNPTQSVIYVFQDASNFMPPHPVVALAHERVVSALVAPELLIRRLGGCARYLDEAACSYLGVWGERNVERFFALLAAGLPKIDVIRQRPSSARMEWRRSALATA